MSQDFLDELGELALGSRLKRLSERMLADAAKVYQAFGIDAQPKWFTLLALLHQQQPISVVEAAERLGLTQPAISQFCRQLVQADLVQLVTCEQDSRRRLISLTNKGKQEVLRMQPMWQAVQQAAVQLCRELENDFYVSLQKCEKALTQRSLLQRTLDIHDAASRH
ncbi:MarR family transcriptional regulator [Aliiglaciecola sp. CAU 1673]|uniref:MarR family winged helix-turn-helix transcriptional regulator n=1 Tax=Aliiglaciecola sp. CAU 1673 TaxID=3032595 RepID=UPI0023DBF5B7|nr:MarR family transcriptional regulator [Aliiglaciecola sp. CAU 1673]MDF2178126.1 MarR family transcriptional regulator [Aliiglaciecola sp. CAU 1673]